LDLKGDGKSVFKRLGVSARSKARTRDKISFKVRMVVNCNGVLNVLTQAIHAIPCDEKSVVSCNPITIYDE
jgi:hypothetical protein